MKKLKKYFIFSDVHGFYDELMLALSNAGFDKDNPNHIIVSLGDLLDRGPKPLDCLLFVNSLPDSRKILIRGNHEDLMEQLIARQSFNIHDIENGAQDTVFLLTGYGKVVFTEFDALNLMRTNKPYNNYIQSTIDYYEDDKQIFVHGWIPCKSNDPNMYHAHRVKYILDENWRNGDWKRARWINGMDAWSQGIRVDGKTIYCGHWHTSWGHSKLHKFGPEWNNKYSTNPEHRKAHFEPFIDDGICAIDACTAYSGKVNVVTIDN